MATLPTLRPAAYVNSALVTTTDVTNVNDANDATYNESEAGNGVDGFWRYSMDNTPTDFASMDSFTITIRCAISATGDDTWSVNVYLTDSAGNTLNGTPTPQSLNLGTTAVQEFTFTHSMPTTNDKTTWDGAHFEIDYANVKTKGSDGNTFRVMDVWLDGAYTLSNQPPNTPVITAPADTATVGGTVSLEATVSDPDSDNVYAVWELWASDGSSLVEDITENVTTVTSGSTHTTSWDSAVNTNGTYQLRAWAVDTNSVQSSTYDTHTITLEEPLPATPANLTVSSVTYDSITVSWDSVTGADTYDVERRVDSGTWASVSSAQATTTYTDSDTITAGSLYEYRVRATNQTGSSSWSTILEHTAGQVATPTSTVSNTNWVDETAGTTDIHTSINDDTLSTYIEATADSATAVFALTNLTDPEDHTQHVITFKMDVV